MTLFRNGSSEPSHCQLGTELGLTQADLAERAGMTQPQLSRLESGGATPTVPLLARLATALEADLDISFKPHTPLAA